MRHSGTCGALLGRIFKKWGGTAHTHTHTDTHRHTHTRGNYFRNIWCARSSARTRAPEQTSSDLVPTFHSDARKMFSLDSDSHHKLIPLVGSHTHTHTHTHEGLICAAVGGQRGSFHACSSQTFIKNSRLITQQRSITFMWPNSAGVCVCVCVCVCWLHNNP